MNIRTALLRSKKDSLPEEAKQRIEFLNFIWFAWDTIPYKIDIIDTDNVKKVSDTTYDEVKELFVQSFFRYMRFDHALPIAVKDKNNNITYDKHHIITTSGNNKHFRIYFT